MTSSRIAGAILGVSALLWILMIAAWPFLIGTRNTATTDEMIVVMERASHLLDREAAFRGIWIIEALGAIGMAVAAFALMHRADNKAGVAPVGWAAVGVGSTVYVAMYGVMLGSYWPAAQVATDNPAILASAITGAMALFFLSNIALNAGFALTFLCEARSPATAIPRWVAWFGVLLSVLAFLASGAGLATSPKVSAVANLDATALIAVAHFAAIAVLGFGISRSNPA